jgi:hypothetical protein
VLVHGQLVRRFYRSGAGARSLTEVVATGIKKVGAAGSLTHYPKDRLRGEAHHPNRIALKTPIGETRRWLEAWTSTFDASADPGPSLDLVTDATAPGLRASCGTIERGPRSVRRSPCEG